jgi:hypothetical protein
MCNFGASAGFNETGVLIGAIVTSLRLWLGAFRERVCWWEVVLLVISAFAGGKSFCWSDGPLLAKRPDAGGKSLCWPHGPLLAVRPFAGGTALCWWYGPLLVVRALLVVRPLLVGWPFAGETQFAEEIIKLGL